MRVLGIDPGTSVTGYGAVDAAPGSAPSLVECGVIRTPARDSLSARLRAIHDELQRVIARLAPELIAIEGIFYARNVRTTIVLGHARGVILLAAEEAGIPVAEYSPAMVKKTIVGRGGALKPQVGFMVAQLLRLASAPQPADAADGVALALTHLLRAAPRTLRPMTRSAR
jgi:crossover junction endodeoxyribonuclease RuvC